MLELKNIDKSFKIRQDKSQQVLKDLSVSFADSGLVTILGRSGGGKSTLLNIIGGLTAADCGVVIYNGQVVKDLAEFRKSKVGFVFQDYNLIPHLTAVDNIIAGMADDVDKRKQLANKLLDELAIADCAEKRPTQLSGGQCQRLAIARMLSKEVAIVLADEATSSLDKASAQRIMAILKRISKQKLVIFVTHDKALAYQYSDRVIQLIDGQIKSDEVLNSNLAPTKIKSNTKAMTYHKNIKYLPFKNLIGQLGTTLRNIAISTLIFLSIALSIIIESDFFKDYMYEIYLVDGIKTSDWAVMTDTSNDSTVVAQLKAKYQSLDNVEHIAYQYNTPIRLAGSDYIEGLNNGNPKLSYCDIEALSRNQYLKRALKTGRLPTKPDEVVMTAKGVIRLLNELDIGGERLEDQFNTGGLSADYILGLVKDRKFFVAEYKLPKIQIVGLLDDNKLCEPIQTIYFNSGFTDLFECKPTGLYPVGLKVYKRDLARQRHEALLAVAAENAKISIDDRHQRQVAIAYNKIDSFFEFSKMLLRLICIIAILLFISAFYTILLARKFEIQIYRSLGYNKADIIKIFTLELLYTSIIALLLSAGILAIIYNYLLWLSSCN